MVAIDGQAASDKAKSWMENRDFFAIRLGLDGLFCWSCGEF